ncbi:uncharacterized protein PGTG_17697 [Puccinia graminis f. sp. tritici CRL 75-36-700-3]|uniref:Uncharacterized protein n=1 Tax=Puccinia graminis f. sp. tritici (strain CRL 75-36-700-3 / race SCCL) TaxID=418459 RepID=E3L4H2_PUCGT|nr:uncharacterized protein PGTG_17697 [Puccinia graminis f. sp. tritici CRL 75-36-700-3]EFP91447.2 hypothetical protein PGTG_17697 [Puccinia graminis f. sp. tritici CRL 75-36-700-3]
MHQPMDHDHAPTLGKPNLSQFRIQLMAETANIKRSCIARSPCERGNTGATPDPNPSRTRGRSTTTRSELNSNRSTAQKQSGAYQPIGRIRKEKKDVDSDGVLDGRLLLTEPNDPSEIEDGHTLRINAAVDENLNQRLAEFDQKKNQNDQPQHSIDSSSTSSAFKPSLLSTTTTSQYPPDHPHEDLLTIASTTVPSACSASSELVGTLDHQPNNHRPQLSFDPVVRIIPNPDEENSSDEENPRQRSRSRTRKRPVRLCTKKIALPLNISTSSLIGIGHHSNHSNASLIPNSPPGGVSSRELFAQTRKEIDEDEQFIPDVPRYLNLTLPSITRQPDRRALRLEEEHRLERWRQMGGGHKSNLKPNAFSNLSHLSPALREQLTSATVPIQLTTNTAINSIASSISPDDVLTQSASFSKQLTSVDSKAQLKNSEPVHSIAPPIPGTITSPDCEPAHISVSVIDQTVCAESESPCLLMKDGYKRSPFRWFGQKAKSIRLDRQRKVSGNLRNAPTSPPAESTGDSPPAPLQKTPTPAWVDQSSQCMSPDESLEGAPLKRMSTPRCLAEEVVITGAPLQRTATPSTSLQKPLVVPPQHNSTQGAPLEKTSTPGAALQRSATTGTLGSKPKQATFFKKLAIWRKTPPSSDRTELTIDPASGILDNVMVISTTSPTLPSNPIQNPSNASLLLETNGDALSDIPTDKWGSRKEVPLRECCNTCLSSASIEAATSLDNQLSPGALKHYHKKSWILQDTLRQGGIPSQQIKLISEELGAPYTSWVAQDSKY